MDAGRRCWPRIRLLRDSHRRRRAMQHQRFHRHCYCLLHRRCKEVQRRKLLQVAPETLKDDAASQRWKMKTAAKTDSRMRRSPVARNRSSAATAAPAASHRVMKERRRHQRHFRCRKPWWEDAGRLYERRFRLRRRRRCRWNETREMTAKDYRRWHRCARKRKKRRRGEEEEEMKKRRKEEEEERKTGRDDRCLDSDCSRSFHRLLLPLLLLLREFFSSLSCAWTPVMLHLFLLRRCCRNHLPRKPGVAASVS